MSSTLIEHDVVRDASATSNGGRLTPQQSRSTSWMLSSVALVGCLSGTSLAAPQTVPTSTALVDATRSARVEFLSRTVAAGVAGEQEVVEGGHSLSDRDEVAWIKDHSGLTWDQLGKVFGVSRRAVHMWANGGRLNESNARRLREFSAVIRGMVADATTPEDVRGRLLEVGPDGVSIIDRMRNERSSGATWGAPFGPEHLIDASREASRTAVSEVDL